MTLRAHSRGCLMPRNFGMLCTYVAGKERGRGEASPVQELGGGGERSRVEVGGSLVRRERRRKPEKEEEKPMGGRVGGCGRGGNGDREKGGSSQSADET